MDDRIPATSTAVPLLWDVFCRVIDNFGDIGVCWRLACDLGERGQRVRLWVDDPSALRWMAPAGHPRVEVAHWTTLTLFPPPGDVVVEAFGCDPPADFVAAMAGMAATARAPAWINLEYLSAEPYVERNHGLSSPQMSGPGRGLTKWFFYPGFAAATGGLLHEQGLVAQQASFDRDAWLADHGLALRAGERLVSLFCYPGAPIDRLIASLAADGRPTLIATAPGAATGATRAAIARVPSGTGGIGGIGGADGANSANDTAAPPTIRQHPLPWLSQFDFDRLLWAADLNLVRGEDSWIRAHWAGKPFIWQAYAQHDGAHAPKVEAFLKLALQGASTVAAELIDRWTHAWNGLDAADSDLPPWTLEALEQAGAALGAWRDRLATRRDLVTRLLAFVREKG